MSMTAHMLEHSAIAAVLAPLVALAVRRPLVRPLVAWPLFVGTLVAVNVPAVIDRLEEHVLAHAGSLLVTVGVSILFWVAALRSLHGLAAGAYLITAAMASDLIGAWYMAMGETGAGVAMVAGMVPMAAAAVYLTWTGLVDEERKAARLETHAAR
jgi:cytochrome c oxidase assembly factor CtaG